METYDKARNAGADHKTAMIIEKLVHDKMLCANSGLHAEASGISYDIWRRCCNV
jgi:hypothetical protein